MYIKGTLPKNCPYVVNDSSYQKRKDTAILTLPFNVSNKSKLEFFELNYKDHSEIGCYDIIRTAICPKCESDNTKEEWADRKDVLFFKYKCKDCNHKWNNFEKQIEFNKKEVIRKK
jgi:Zn ribbon nucleic-acid-binding protein